MAIACHNLSASLRLTWKLSAEQLLYGRSQHQCQEQEDVLRPYTSLDYAWDEPALPHRLDLALPGNRKLGSFDLEKV